MLRSFPYRFPHQLIYGRLIANFLLTILQAIFLKFTQKILFKIQVWFHIKIFPAVIRISKSEQSTLRFRLTFKLKQNNNKFTKQKIEKKKFNFLKIFESRHFSHYSQNNLSLFHINWLPLHM